MAINELLVKLDSLGFKTVAYADEVAVAVTGMHLETLSQRLEETLKIISSWSVTCGLSVNPGKTELVLFTNKYKIPQFPLPRLNGEVLTLSVSAKYLGVIFDRKLSWSLNIISRSSKAIRALYVCRKAIGLHWGINPGNSFH
ncbi:hypothetical protein FF38_14428 [Lucilia cuprina]|uniref:Uncharacterized protein n=1 Tax=Lucilia cuprina TaxID=7375 RepID=A0A0L0CGC5_LUCCU|nr:hypothetical protein FF38_14428 [Lucilia cuprina]